MDNKHVKQGRYLTEERKITLTKNYVAVDIGASSGRLMLSQLIDGKITLKEIHRFKNGFTFQEGHDRWDIDHLLKEIILGLAKLKEQGIDECILGIDTWAVDYCLVDAQGKLLAQPIAYRDARTNEAIKKFSENYSLDRLYTRTGIQLQPFNTLFQLFVEDRSLLDKADKLLLIPDYLGYQLTGKMVTEKTNASTTQLLNVHTKDWDEELLAYLHLSKSLFAPLVDAGTTLGALQREKFRDYDLPKTQVVNVASHDTASAIIGTPTQTTNWAYLSSGTWSLLGVESKVENISREAFLANYTNEWGAHNTIRFLKNIMGMWLIQEVAREDHYAHTYAEFAQMASKTPAFSQLVDVNDPAFLNPTSMTQAFKDYCQKTQQKVPTTLAEIARCVYDNLALCYAFELEQLMKLTQTQGKVDCLHIVGGGSNNAFLNQLTADVAQMKVIAGPGEATALGNIMMQMLNQGEFDSIQTARKVLANSFDYAIYLPQKNYDDVLVKYRELITKK